MNPWRVGMLGAGKMAQGFDFPGAPRVLSVAHAFSRASRFALGGFYDAHPERAEAAEQRWQAPPSPRDRGAWLDAGWDVVYIGTPNAQHAADLRDVLDRQPRAVLIEKPLAMDLHEGIELLESARDRGIPVLINYPRRWHSAVAQLRDMSRQGLISPPSAALIAVTGGAEHNLPHTLDLLHTVWGGGWRVTPTAASRGASLLLWQRDGLSFPMTVCELSSAHYVWEAHFYCPEGKLQFSQSPEIMEWAAPAPHPDYGGFQVLTPVLRAEMENEPLLDRVVEALAGVIEDAATGRAMVENEIDGQRLAAQAMNGFQRSERDV